MERLLQALRSLYIACFTSLNPQELGTVVLPNSQMRKLRFSHCLDLHPVLLASEL